MFFVRSLINAVREWWHRFGYSILTSFSGAILNPFYLLVLSVVLWLGKTHQFILVFESAELFIFGGAVAFALIPLFPTSIASIVMIKRLRELETVYLVDYFKDFFIIVWRYLGRSIILMIIYMILAVLLSNALIFYVRLFQNFYLKIIFGAVIVWIYILFMMTAYILAPVMDYNQDMDLKTAYIISFKLIIAEIPSFFAMFIIDFIVFSVLTVFNAFSLFFYFGFSASFRISLYRQSVKKYSKNRQEVAEEEEISEQDKIHDTWRTIFRKHPVDLNIPSGSDKKDIHNL